MKVKSIAFCNSFDLHSVLIGLDNQYLGGGGGLSGRLRQVLLHKKIGKCYCMRLFLSGIC